MKTVKIPNAGHPITIERAPERVRVLAGGRVVADSRNALALRESDYPVVYYIPRGDVDMTLLARTENATYCPYKGDAGYYSVIPGGDRAVNAVWTYEAPHEAVDAIKDHLAFYPDRVDAIELTTEPSREDRNKTLVLEAFDTLFNKRDYEAAERFWSPEYIQHSMHIKPGREGLFELIRSIPPTLRYEHDMIVAEGDLVILHGRFSGIGQPKNWIAADVVRIENGLLAEHWDVIEDEASAAESASGLPMFGGTFPE
jgi:uncharacterized protein (DUF427 family)/predicted SnoaL-like aldol condensation-catalyzing enzyme